MIDLDTITQADALTWLKTLPDESVDMGLMSPPYDNLRSYNGYVWDFEGIAAQLYRVIKPGGVLVWIVGDATIDGSETLTSFKQALYFKEVCGFRMHDTMIYHRQGRFPESNRYWPDFEYMFVLSKGVPDTFNALKEHALHSGKKVSTERQKDGSLIRPKTIRVTTNHKSLSNIWYISRGDMTHDDDLRYEHPAAFPEALAKRHILTWSNPGDIVLDCFMGSGTTAKMARNLDRHFIGCDVSQEYVDLANRRLANTDPYQSTQVTTDAVQLSLFQTEIERKS